MSKSVWSEPRNGGVVLRWYSQNRRTPSGRPAKEISRLYANQQEADAAAAQLKAMLPQARRVRKAGPSPIDPMPLREVVDLWAIAHKDDSRPGRPHYLRKTCALTMRLSSTLGWSTSLDVTQESIEQFLRDNEGRGKRQLATIRGILRWARGKLKQPLDPDADSAMKAPPSNQADVDLLRADEVALIRKRAGELGLTALIECLLVYGWRPVTACRLKIGDVDFDQARIKIGVKKNKVPWRHPLIASHLDLLRACAGSRPKGEALFLSPATGNPWRLSGGDGGAEELGKFFQDAVYPEGPVGPAGGVYQLKRWAITNMDSGGDPWRKRLTLAQIALYTAHRTQSQIMRYLKTNEEEARDVMMEEERGGQKVQREVMTSSDQSKTVGKKWANSSPALPIAAPASSHNVIQFPGITDHKKRLPTP